MIRQGRNPGSQQQIGLARSVHNSTINRLRCFPVCFIKARHNACYVRWLHVNWRMANWNNSAAYQSICWAKELQIASVCKSPPDSDKRLLHSGVMTLMTLDGASHPWFVSVYIGGLALGTELLKSGQSLSLSLSLSIADRLRMRV